MRKELDAAAKTIVELSGRLCARQAENAELRRRLDSAVTGIEDRDDAIDCLRRIGDIVGCDHADGRDDRMRLIRCVREEFERLKAASPPQPAAPRRFRYCREYSGGRTEWEYGIYWSRSNRHQLEYRGFSGGRPGVGEYPGLEWLDPDPAGRSDED